MRRILAAGLAAIVIGAAPASAPAQPAPSSRAVIAKTCSAGYKHAVIGGAEKCLRRGQFCARALKSQYPRYGYRCVPTGSGWRLK